MIKVIFRIIGIVVLAMIVFLAISLRKGGDPFRWFGDKSEQAGGILKDKSQELGKEADRIKKRTDSLVNASKKVKEEIRKTQGKVREFTGRNTDK